MKKNYFFVVLFFLFYIKNIHAQEYDISALTLRECVEIALENNLTLKRSQLDLLNTQAGLLEAKGQRLPSLSTGISSGYRWGRSINPVTNLFETRRIGNVNVSASSNLPIYAGSQITNSIKQSEVNLEIGQFNVEATKNDITLSVINLFVNVAFAMEQLNVAQSQLKTSTDQLNRISRLVDAGSVPLSDKLDLEAQKATSELEVINANNNLRIAKLNLSQQLQIPFTDQFDVVIPDLSVEDLDMETGQVENIYAVAVSNLPQIKAAELGVISSDYSVRIARGAFLPTFGVNANVFSNYVDQYTFGVRDPLGRQFENNLSQAVNLSLNIPVFSNFRNTAGLQRARVQKQMSEIQELEVKNQLRQDIETSYTSAYAAKQSYQSSLRRVESLEEAFRMAQQRFNVGAINSVDFQIAQNNLFNGQADLTTAKYEYIFRVKVLDFYLGNPITF